MTNQGWDVQTKDLGIRISAQELGTLVDVLEDTLLHQGYSDDRQIRALYLPLKALWDAEFKR